MLSTLLLASLLALAPDAGLKRTCTRCHGLDVIRAQRLTKEEWNIELRKMEHIGAEIRNREALLTYLAKRYGAPLPKRPVKSR